MRYAWKDGTGFGVKADVAGMELERIDRENGGVTPAAVVDASRPEEAPLHPVFEWDDATAGELYRVDQARRVIRSVRVIEVDQRGQDKPPAIAYVSVRPEGERGTSYQPIARVMSDADMRRQAIESAATGLESWIKRHEHLIELAGEVRMAKRIHRRVVKRLGEVATAGV